MVKSLRGIIAIVAMLLYSVIWGAEISQAGHITLYNTGVDDSNVLLLNGTIDPHYSLITSPDSTYTGPNTYASWDQYPILGGPWWVLNGPDSKWITPAYSSATVFSAGYYIYRTTFDLTGSNPETARIKGDWSVDNIGVDILINGISTGNSINASDGTDWAFSVWHSFYINSGFESGINTLDFVLFNGGGDDPFQTYGTSFSGLRVEMTGTVGGVGRDQQEAAKEVVELHP
jgi:hypothetical protein